MNNNVVSFLYFLKLLFLIRKIVITFSKLPQVYIFNYSCQNWAQSLIVPKTTTGLVAPKRNAVD
jgi:hypothetical protein